MDSSELLHMILHRYKLGVNDDRVLETLCTWVGLSHWDFKQGSALYKLLIEFLDNLDLEEHRKLVLEVLDNKTVEFSLNFLTILRDAGPRKPT